LDLQTFKVISLYTLRYNIIIFDTFCCSLCFCELCQTW